LDWKGNSITLRSGKILHFPEKALPQERLRTSFNRLWPEFEGSFQKILGRYAEAAKPVERRPEDMIVEILEISRAVQRNSEQLLRLSTEPVAAIFGDSGAGYSGYSGYKPDPRVF
jgi:hypothetical protein